MAAVALTDGTVTVESFSPARFADPALRPLMRRISVSEDPEITANWVADPAHRIEIRLRNGETRELRATRARGHASNPLDDDEITAKFRTNSRAGLEPDAAERLLDVLWSLDALADVEELTALLRPAT
jgi:2-methylcitrate dehydratase